ncbi:signal transducer CD24 [Bos indicus]|nr:signal transducer CD24 [Bos indicus x Bos taurus]XP_061283665.1 signal transducer CD24 [Bos javanicus]
MRTWDAPGNPHRPASTRSSKNKASGGGKGKARPARGRAHAVLRARAPPASPTDQPEKGARLPAPGAPCQVPPAGRAPHLACTPPAILRHPAIQRDALRTDGADMGRAIVARLGLGLLLLALLLPTQTYSNQTTVVTPSNSSQTTSPAPHPANATTKASDGTLQSTASLFVISVSLLHLYC